MVTALGSCVKWPLSSPCNRNVDTYRGHFVSVPGYYKEVGIGVQGKLSSTVSMIFNVIYHLIIHSGISFYYLCDV